MKHIDFCPVILLPLKNLMVLEPDNETTDNLLQMLEDAQAIPRTVAWKDRRGLTHRLYGFDENKVLWAYCIKLGRVSLTMATGANNTCQIPSPLQKDSQLKWLQGRSLDEMKPVQLPESSLDWLEPLAIVSGRPEE